MALKRPRSWEEIESDEDFGSLAPERKLQILDRWSSAVRDYGTATGALSRDYNVSKLDSFRNQKAQQFEALKAPPEPESSNILRRALDIPTSALGGVVTGLKGVSDAFGANNPVSQELAEYQQFYNEALSPEGKAAQRRVGEILKEAEDGSLLEQVGAGARAFAAAPLETTSQALGTMAPTIATGVAGKALQLGARGVQVLQGAVGAAMQAGIVKSQIYDGTKNLLLESGKTEEEADQIASEAQSYGGKNLDQILLAAGLGVAGATTGVERILGGAFNKGAAASGVIRNTLKTGAVEAIPESIQAGQEQVATNIAAQREGFEVPTMRGVVSNAVMEGIAGFVGGAPAGTVEALATSEKIKEDAPLTSEALRKKSLQAVSDTQAEIIKETTAAAEEDAATLEILDDMEAKAAAEKPPVISTTATDPAAPVEDRIKAAMDELQEAGRRFDLGEISNTELGQAAKRLDNLRAEKRNVARGEGDNVLQKYVDKTKVNSNDILDLLSEYGGVDAQTLADVQNPEAAAAWLQRNNVGVPGQPWRGRQLTPFEDQGAGTPLFDQAPKEPAAPPVTTEEGFEQERDRQAETPPTSTDTGNLSSLTDEELDQEDTILQRRAENETDPVRLEEVNAEIQKVTEERARRATPTPAPAAPPVAEAPAPAAPEPVVEDTPPPAPLTLDQFTEDELDQESTILERQAESEADPVRVEEINTQIQAVAAERQRRTAPLVADSPVASAPAPAPVASEPVVINQPTATGKQPERVRPTASGRVATDPEKAVDVFLKNSGIDPKTVAPEDRAKLVNETRQRMVDRGDIPPAPAPFASGVTNTQTPAAEIKGNPLATKSQDGYIPTVDAVRIATTLVGKEELQKMAKQRPGGEQGSTGQAGIALERAARKVLTKELLQRGVDVPVAKENTLLNEARAELTNVPAAPVAGQSTASAPASSVSGVTTTQDTFTLSNEPLPPAPRQQQPQAPKPVVADSPDQGQLSLGSGVQGTNRDANLTEGLRESGVNVIKPSDAAANYRKSLVDEARSARRLAPVKDIDQVVNELEGQTWVPSKFKSPVMRRQYARQLLDEARNERAAELGVGTKTVVPNSQAEAEVYDDSLSSSQVPSAKTIFGRLTKEAGVAGKKTGTLQKDAEREVKRESLRQQAREIEAEANRLVAANLGIPSPETVVFTADFAGNNTLPQRATTTKDGATRLDNIFVNDSDITARQLDRGMDITIPKDQRNSVVEGITYNRKTGKVTAAVSGQTIVSGPDQLQRVKKKRTKELSSSFVVPEESKERRENLITIVQEFDNETQSNYRSITRQVEGANIKLPAEFGPRVKAIALQIAGETLGKGKKITASTALKQSYRKMWERLKVRPELMQMSLDMGVDPNDDTTWIDIAETTDDTADTGRTAGGKKGEKVLVRNPRSDISRLVGRMTNTQAQNVLNATNQKLDFGETLSSAERQAFEAAREYTLLRDRVQSEGKLDKVPAKEREELTYADLQEIGGVETQLPGTDLPPGAFASAESRVTGEPVEVSEAELAEAKDLIEEAVESFPAVNELIETEGRGYNMYVLSNDPRTIYVNLKGIAQVVQGVDRDVALAYIKKLLGHETRHMALLRAMPVSELTAIGEGLTEAQLREAAESYHAKSEFATEEEREAALKAFMENPNVAAMEYITMLSERLQSGTSIQDLNIEDMPLTLLERIVEALRAILDQLRTRMMLRQPGYEALAIGVERLEEGIRLLEEDITLGDRIEEANSQGQPPDVVEVTTPDVDIFPSANDTLGVDDNGFLRPATDTQGRRAYRVTINGIKVETTAKDPQIAARNAVFKMFDRAKQVFFEGQTYTSPKALIGAITASGRRVYKNDWGRKFAKPAIRKVTDGTPILPATQSEQAELPLIFPSMANPAMRVRVGQINPEGRPKGGFWDRLKLMVRGRFSETRKRTGGVSGSGAATPLERDAIIAQQARIKGTIVKAESVVKNYRRERKKHKDFTDEQINAALGTTENPYTEAQVKELNKIKNAKAKDAKREEFRKANAATDRLVRQQALSQLPGYNPKYDGETEFHTGLAKAVEDMRIAIDEMSRALMAGDYIPADLKARVEQNLNVYVHRSYTIFDNPEWKRFMLAPQTDEHRRIQTAAARLFQKYAVAEIAQELRAEAEKTGAQMSQRDAIRLASRERERIATRAGNMLVDYLSIADDKSNNFFVTGELPGQRKLDIIKVRGQIPKEVRELWGEIQKADDNFLKTMSKMAGYMSATDTARELVRIGLEQKYMWKAGVSEGERPAGYHLIYNKGDAAPMSVSPMDDVYAPEEVGTFMRSFRDHKTMYGWARQLAFMTAQTMAMKTIGNFPQGYVRNFFGNPFIMVNGGYINPAHPAEMFKAAKKAFTLALTSSGLRNNEAIVKSVSELTSAGLIGEGVDSGLMREMTETGLGDLTWDKLYEAGAYETAMKRAARQATGATRNTFEFFARIYQGVDDFWKVFAYEMEKFYQRRTHSDWTEAQISKEAIDRVRNKVPTYSLSPELTRSIRNIPFIAPFITWTSETIRTSANNLAIAAEDIRVGKETKNPEMVKNGYRAIRGFAFALGAFPTLAMISKAMFGYDDDDEDAYREGLPEWEQNASLVFLGKAADGTGSHFNASFLDPYQSRMEGPIAFLRAMRNGDAFTDALVKGGMETLRPLLSEQLLFGAITSILRNRTAQGKPIYNEQDTAFNKTLDTMGHLALAAGPGTVVGSGRRLYLASQGTVLPTGQTYDVGNELLGMFGGQKVSSIDFRTTLNRAKNKYASSRAEATQLFSRVFSSQGTVDLEDIGPAYENAARAHRELQEEMMRAFDNAIRMGVPRKDAIQILRGGMGGAEVSKDDLRAILSGKPRRWTPSEVSLDSAKEGKIPDGRARLKALRDYMRSVKSAGNQ